LGACGQQAKADSVTLQQLLGGATITVGDKEFYGFENFSSFASGGAVAVDPSTINVTPFFLGSEIGLQFQSASFAADSGQTQDTLFDFFVRVLPGYGMLISDNTLTMVGAARGDGRVTIIETATALNGDGLASKIVQVQGTDIDLSDHMVYLYPASVVHVSKDIGLVGGLEGDAAVSHFTQTFSQTVVPEPVTIAGILLGIGGLVRYTRKRAA